MSSVSGSPKAHRREKKQSNGLTYSPSSASLQKKIVEKEEREQIVLWRKPFVTVKFFTLESIILAKEYFFRLWQFKKYVILLTFFMISVYAASCMGGPHQMLLQVINKNIWWCLWWVWLGILSSVGLGTGLHTFLLYLGPHIASVTIAAYLCESVNFPSPPYPDEIICPDDVGSSGSSSVISIWTIMSKVRLEAFMWGAGTAFGELPPYFMARGARLSGVADPDDEELAEFEELQKLKDHPEEMSLLDRAKLSIEKLVEKVGFFGILACASIPNPLFDLAGITCGHFLVPFWTFFGATLIGKAVIKMHIQKLFVIIAFNEPLLERALEVVDLIPIAGPRIRQPFYEFLQNQKRKLKRKSGDFHKQHQGSGNALSWLFEKLVIVMIIYFVISIVNSLAQSYHKRLCRNKRPQQKLASD